MKKVNWLVVAAGLVVGAAAVLLTALGNPGNMGFCIACFLRDTSGALGLHSAGVVQYIRPEIIGIVLGSLIAALGFKEFKGRGGSSPALRFVLGMFVMIGALMFLGCPLRMMIRIGGGDLNALVGLIGFFIGILIGIACLKRGFTLKRSYEVSVSEGSVLPTVMAALLILVLTVPALFKASEAGPGSMHAPFWIALIVALVVGALVIIQLIRRAMKPIRQLTTQLDEAEDANAQLQREIDTQRPVINASYLRKLLSGHVASQDEFQYMMDSLGLTGDVHHYVLFCIANRQDSEVADPNAEYDTITAAMERHLSGAYPLYYYATLFGSFVVLVTYANSDADSFSTLQQHVVQLHDELADAGLWFYAGVGSRCTQPSRLWESYEQARAASRYTAKHHIFLPYDFIRKDTQSWYYPIEISAKLLHFITTGNKDQTTDMFALIHRENVEERSLPLPLLNMLLSDLKNTLFKARFQVLPSQSEEMAAKLKKLDERLYSPTPTFAQLEDDALCLCEFFVKVSSPSTPIPDVERYLQENYTDPSLCLSKVGDRFNISDTYLSHMFKEKTGQNFSVYLERLRMNEAARRLTSGDCNLTVLYADLGYTNPTSFRRAFKKYYGMTPSEMRDQPRKQEEKSE